MTNLRRIQTGRAECARAWVDWVRGAPRRQAHTQVHKQADKGRSGGTVEEKELGQWYPRAMTRALKLPPRTSADNIVRCSGAGPARL